MNNAHRYYSCYAAAFRASNPQFKQFWMKLANKFYEEARNENN